VSDSREPHTGPDPGRPADRWLRIYLEDSLLWPVLIAGAGILVTSGAGVLLMALRGRNPFVWVALLLLAGLSCDAVYRDLRQRRFGLASRAVVGVWVASAGAAVLAVWLGLA
jgi:hypothetical protein